jgi:hypothetical protein
MRRFLPVLGPTPRRLIVATLIVLGAIQLPLAATLAMLATYRVYLAIIRTLDQMPKAIQGPKSFDPVSGGSAVSTMPSSLSAPTYRPGASKIPSFDECLNRFTSSEQTQIRKFIDKLKDTDDYVYKKELIDAQILNVLNRAVEDSEFKKMLTDRVQDALGTCGDQAAHTFNQIFIDYYAFERGITDQELAERLIGCRRAKLLEQVVGQWYNKRKAVGQRDESVEVGLYCHLELAADLGLPPAPITTMLYSLLARGVTSHDLNNFKDDVLKATSTRAKQADILLDDTRWLERLKMNHEKEFAEIVEAAQNELADLDDKEKTLKPEEYRRLQVACGVRCKNKEKALYRKLTRNHLLKQRISTFLREFWRSIVLCN